MSEDDSVNELSDKNKEISDLNDDSNKTAIYLQCKQELSSLRKELFSCESPKDILFENEIQKQSKTENIIK